MIDLVTLEQAKYQVSITLTDVSHDVYLEFLISAASEAVMDYIKRYTVPDEWAIGGSPATYAVPVKIQHATLLYIADAFANRESGTANPMSDAWMNILADYRTPTLA